MQKTLAGRVPLFGPRCASVGAVLVYNVRKLDFQANLCVALAEDKKKHCWGDLVLGWGV